MIVKIFIESVSIHKNILLRYGSITIILLLSAFSNILVGVILGPD